jgi:hypothetical protein
MQYKPLEGQAFVWLGQIELNMVKHVVPDGSRAWRYCRKLAVTSTK